MPKTGWLKQQTSISQGAGGLEVWHRDVCLHRQVWWGPSSLLVDGCLPAVSSHGNHISIELVMPPSYLVLCLPLLLLPSVFPSIRVFSNESVLSIMWPKYWSFSFSISPSIFQSIFRVDFPCDWLVWFPCSLRDTQESSPTPQFKNINSLSLSLLYSPTLTFVHDYWKNHSFD